MKDSERDPGTEGLEYLEMGQWGTSQRIDAGALAGLVARSTAPNVPVLLG